MVKHRKSSGFTLIELLIVISIIGIVAGAIIVTINPLTQMQKARNAQRKADLRTMANAVERYKATTGSYPITLYSGWCGPDGSPWFCGGDFIPNIIASGELKALQKDPNTGKPNNYPSEPNCWDAAWGNHGNHYIYKSDGTDYKLLAMCSPEGNVFSSTDPFYDPVRPDHAWQVSSSDISKYW